MSVKVSGEVNIREAHKSNRRMTPLQRQVQSFERSHQGLVAEKREIIYNEAKTILCGFDYQSDNINDLVRYYDRMRSDSLEAEDSKEISAINGCVVGMKTVWNLAAKNIPRKVLSRHQSPQTEQLTYLQRKLSDLEKTTCKPSWRNQKIEKGCIRSWTKRARNRYDLVDDLMISVALIDDPCQEGYVLLHSDQFRSGSAAGMLSMQMLIDHQRETSQAQMTRAPRLVLGLRLN